MEAYCSLQTNTGRPSDIAPNANVLLNLPLVQYLPLQNITVKDQNLLKPPPVMGASELPLMIKIIGWSEQNSYELYIKFAYILRNICLFI